MQGGRGRAETIGLVGVRNRARAAIGAPRAREGRRGRLGGAAGTLVTPWPQGENLGKQVPLLVARQFTPLGSSKLNS